MAEKSTFGLKIEQLAEIFSLGLDDNSRANAVCGDDTMAGLLKDQLGAELPKGSFPSDSMLMVMSRMGFDVSCLAGKSLGELLLSPESDIVLLQAIKDCSKRLSQSFTSEAKKAIATTIYYAALANALIHHDEKITKYSYESLSRSFATLVNKKWMAPDLASLFSRARDICDDKRSDK